MGTLKTHKGVRDALETVAARPPRPVDPTVDTPIWDLIASSLFYIANSPDKKVRGSMARATKAQKIILDRMVGRRRPGTHPAQASSEKIDFVDLTAGVLPAKEEESVDEGA